MPKTHPREKNKTESDVTSQAKAEARTSIKTHRNAPREIDSDLLGTSAIENDASSSEISNRPSPCTNDRLGRESRVSTNQDKNSLSASASRSKTSTDVVKSQGEGPVTQSSSFAPASFHERIRSNAPDLFSSVEPMLLRLIQGYGFSDGYKMFCVAHSRPK